MSKLDQLPTELLLFNVFEYLIGPVGFFTSKLGFGNEPNSIQEVIDLLKHSPIQNIPLENLKGLNSLVACANKSLCHRLIIPEEIYWLHVSNMYELALNFRRCRDYQGMDLGRGDLTPDEERRMYDIQSLIEATELGGIPVHHTQIIQEYEKRLKKFIMQPEKYNRVKEKTSITSFELFVFKAIMLSLDMVSYFDVESAGTRRWEFEETVRQMTSLEYYNTPLALESEWSFSEGALLTTMVNPSLDEMDPKSYDTIQYFTIYLREYCDINSLHDRVFPNVKYLRVIFEKYYWYSCSEVGSTNQDTVLFDLLKKKTFPKLIHLSVREFPTTSIIFESEILDQLLYLDITGNEMNLAENRHSAWNGENGLNSLYPKLLTDNNLMHHLILQGVIHHYWPDDVTIEILEQYYNSTKDHFVASLSHSSINHFYQNCNE